MEMKLTDEEVKIIAADKNWRNGATYDLAADLLSTRAKLAALQESSKRQVDQFNDGYDAAFAGEPDNIEPDYEVDEDQWRIGYAWAMYDKLKRDIAALQDKVRWVPVEERLPKSETHPPYHKYLVVSRGVVVGGFARRILEITHGIHGAPDWHEHKWVNDDMEEIFSVSHYMPAPVYPLPVPPIPAEGE